MSVAWVAAGATVVNGVLSYDASRRAADAQEDASDAALAVFEKNAGIAVKTIQDSTNEAVRTIQDGRLSSERLLTESRDTSIGSLTDARNSTIFPRERLNSLATLLNRSCFAPSDIFFTPLLLVFC